MKMEYIITAVISVVSTLCTILMTYYIFRLTSRNGRKENYLKRILELYYRIEEDYSQISANRHELINVRLYRQIAVNCTMMDYYVRRLPGYYRNRHRIRMLLFVISDEPEKKEYYEGLSKQIKELISGLKNNRKQSELNRINFKRVGYEEE